MDKQEVISRIQDVLVKWGEFSIGEVDGEDVSPCVASHGNIVDLAEYFNNTGVTVEVYLPNSHSILMIAERYDAQEQKVFDSCRDENF